MARLGSGSFSHGEMVDTPRAKTLAPTPASWAVLFIAIVAFGTMAIVALQFAFMSLCGFGSCGWGRPISMNQSAGIAWFLAGVFAAIPLLYVPRISTYARLAFAFTMMVGVWLTAFIMFPIVR